MVLHTISETPASGYTVERYNKNLERQIAQKNKRLLLLVLLSASLTLVFQGGPIIDNQLDRLVHYTKVCWVISVPYFIIQYVSGYTLLDQSMLLDSTVSQDKLTGSSIIFTILTLGKNLQTLHDTVSSTNYWIKKVKKDHGVVFSSQVWVVTEEDSHTDNEDSYRKLEEEGARIVVVPRTYKTLNKTMYKARALQYTNEYRVKNGFSSHKTWVYHQDEETMVGEDTVLGILDFISSSCEALMGSGIILYPQNWTKTYLSIQETTRSSNDIGLIGQIKSLGYSLMGYHGSHFIIRADIENKVGWDFGLSRSEDLVFSIKVKMMLGSVMKPLKGFAYEKPPFTFGDQQKQRKRWIRGAIEVLARDDINLASKLLIFYGLLSWLSALLSILSAIFNLYLSTGGLIRNGGFLAGFIWFMIYYSYLSGFEMHRPYIGPLAKPGMSSLLRLLPEFVYALISDAIGPWNALLFPNSSYDNIQKDV